MTRRRPPEPARRGPGRPPVAPPGEGATIYVRASAAQAEVLDELDAEHRLGGRAATVRRVLDALGADERLRAALTRALRAE